MVGTTDLGSKSYKIFGKIFLRHLGISKKKGQISSLYYLLPKLPGLRVGKSQNSERGMQTDLTRGNTVGGLCITMEK